MYNYLQRLSELTGTTLCHGMSVNSCSDNKRPAYTEGHVTKQTHIHQSVPRELHHYIHCDHMVSTNLDGGRSFNKVFGYLHRRQVGEYNSPDIVPVKLADQGHTKR